MEPNKINELLKNLDMDQTYNFYDEEENNFNEDSYEYLRAFCEQVPFNKDVLNEKSFEKNISLFTSIQISKDILEKINPKLLEFFDKYIKEGPFKENGNMLESSTRNIYYTETIDDVFVIVHEYLHYYFQEKSKTSICASLDVFDEAKSILSEKIVENILKNKIIDLKDYGLNILEKDIEYESYCRLYMERIAAGMYLYYKNIRPLFDECVKNRQPLTIEKIKEHFEKFDKNSIEYKIYLENKDNEFSIDCLKNPKFFNLSYDLLYEHPISYIESLFIEEKMNLKEQDYAEFMKVIDNFCSLQDREIHESSLIMDVSDKFDIGIIKDLKLDKTKKEEVVKLLQKELQKAKDKNYGKEEPLQMTPTEKQIYSYEKAKQKIKADEKQKQKDSQIVKKLENPNIIGNVNVILLSILLIIIVIVVTSILYKGVLSWI